jgi:phage gpG-like protein
MKNFSDLIRDFRMKNAAMKKLRDDMPRIVGVECVRQIKAQFVKANPAGWAARNTATDKAYDYARRKGAKTATGRKAKAKNPYKGSVYSSKNPILKQTGNLRDSITYRVNGQMVNIGVFSEKVIKYARIHNEGLTFKAWGKHTAKMPKRKFMPAPNEPPTAKMQEAIKKKYDYELNKVWKEWK